MTIDFEKEVKNITSNLEDDSKNHIVGGFVPPFCKNVEDVKLIIIGQDPTIQNVKSRDNVKTTLTLDKDGVLKTYIEKICSGLHISLDNVYATNLFKYFYTIPPAKTFDVLEKHLNSNLELLKKELSLFPKCPILTLGQPIFRLLVNRKVNLREYWGYTDKIYKFVAAENNKLGRFFFPFCHLNTSKKTFYKNNFDQYLEFLRQNNN